MSQRLGGAGPISRSLLSAWARKAAVVACVRSSASSSLFAHASSTMAPLARSHSRQTAASPPKPRRTAARDNGSDGRNAAQTTLSARSRSGCSRGRTNEAPRLCRPAAHSAKNALNSPRSM
eukprot:scaffold7070_cov125-Isochrysis_galbana.AAC.4